MGNNRRKGHNYERELAKLFRSLGWEKRKTTRQSSRLLDDCKVDLDFIPFNVQAKSVKSSVNYKKVFEDMESLLKENFDDENIIKKPKMIFHKRGRSKYDHLVVMPFQDFIKILKNET